MATGVLLWYVEVYSRAKQFNIGAILGNILAALVLFVGLGVIIFLIVKLFSKKKYQKSVLRNGIDFGFVISLIFFIGLLIDEFF